MTQVLDSVHLGAERSGETAAPIALALKDAIEMLATAKTAIDQMTEMLQYFTRLGGSGPLRDYREVKANLLRSRALLSTQPDTVAQLTEAALPFQAHRHQRIADNGESQADRDPKDPSRARWRADCGENSTKRTSKAACSQTERASGTHRRGRSTAPQIRPARLF